jgi:hypothetical protein
MRPHIFIRFGRGELQEQIGILDLVQRQLADRRLDVAPCDFRGDLDLVRSERLHCLRADREIAVLVLRSEDIANAHTAVSDGAMYAVDPGSSIGAI